MDWSSWAQRCPGEVLESALLGNQPDSRPGIRASRQSARFPSWNSRLSASWARSRAAGRAARRRGARIPGRGCRARAIPRRNTDRPSRQAPTRANSRTRNAANSDKSHFPDAQRRPEKGRRGVGGKLYEATEKSRRKRCQRSIGLMEIASASRLAPHTTR